MAKTEKRNRGDAASALPASLPDQIHGPPLEPHERARLIDAIIGKRVGDISVGAFVTDVCQLCGALGRISGWAHAQACYHPVNGRSEYVCIACRGAFDSDDRRIVAELDRRATRRCRICATVLEPGQWSNDAEDRRVCAGCTGNIERRGGDVEQQLRELSARRCFALDPYSDDGLRTVDLNLELRRLELEEEQAHGYGKLRLQIERQQRLLALLRELGDRHGVDYLASSGHATGQGRR